ncbi:MAG: ABC transporter substrate-binding protein [Acidimicrobiales bacterium]
MSKKSLSRLMALLAAFSLVAAACGSDAATTETETTEAPATDTTEAPATDTTEAMTDTTEAMTEGAMSASADGTLTVGTLIPITGDLAFLAPPEVAGARLAVEDINAAGGVLGNDAVLIEGDSGDTTVDVANPTVDRLLSEGADVIVGAASSAVSKTVIDKITSST